MATLFPIAIYFKTTFFINNLCSAQFPLNHCCIIILWLLEKIVIMIRFIFVVTDLQHVEFEKTRAFRRSSCFSLFTIQIGNGIPWSVYDLNYY